VGSPLLVIMTCSLVPSSVTVVTTSEVSPASGATVTEGIVASFSLLTNLVGLLSKGSLSSISLLSEENVLIPSLDSSLTLVEGSWIEFNRFELLVL